MPPISPIATNLPRIPAFIDRISELKKKIQIARNKLVFSVNSQIMELYREIGKEITEKQQTAKRGSELIEQIALELKHEFPEIKSFSTRNLYAIAQRYTFYAMKYQFLPHGVAQIPGGHNRLIISKVKNLEESEFYAFETAKNGRDRDTLEIKIKENYYQKLENLANNFIATLPIEQSKLATQTVKEMIN